MVPIHHSPDQRVIGASALSLSLDVSHSRVRKIRENIANHVSALHGTIPPISTDDYEVAHADGTGADGQLNCGADVDPFPNVDDAELNIS
ncbi:hypothetical protein Tco_0384344 [Tanacetum coccineum]